jgi:hypothetical protein
MQPSTHFVECETLSLVCFFLGGIQCISFNPRFFLGMLQILVLVLWFLCAPPLGKRALNVSGIVVLASFSTA